jgi:protein-S-isoprenylcysteine O-methyltransferase Ste14
MSQQPSLFERLKRSRIVQALLVYLAASYAVLQLVETLKELLALPDWIGPVTVILVGIGLLLITATAWVQSLDSTTKVEEAGEVPTDWEIDAADALASLKAGRLPHLT